MKRRNKYHGFFRLCVEILTGSDLELDRPFVDGPRVLSDIMKKEMIDRSLGPARSFFVFGLDLIDGGGEDLAFPFSGVPEHTKKRVTRGDADLLPVVPFIRYAPLAVIQMIIVPDGVGTKEFVVRQEPEYIVRFDRLDEGMFSLAREA